MKLVTMGQAADLIGVNRTTIWRWVQRGYLQPVDLDEGPPLYLDTDVFEVERKIRSRKKAA